MREGCSSEVAKNLHMANNDTNCAAKSPRESKGWMMHGDEHWEFDDEGYMRRRDASINDYKIDESERKFRWER
jgi:nuclear transport factor 2 (NTF2) superfamily protein